MRIRAAVVVVLLARGAWAEPEPVPAPAPAAQPEPPPAPEPTPPPADMIRDNSLLLTHARTARDAARAGDCGAVLELSPKVRALDPTFHDRLFVLDPVIAACVNPGALPAAERPTRIIVREVRAEPPPSAMRITGEVLLGMLVGTGGALIGALLGSGACIGGSDDGGCDTSMIAGAYLGAIATIPLGVRTVGTGGDQTGSLGATYLGSALGGLGGLLMLASGREDITVMGLILAPPLGATIGFNATRRYRPRRYRVVGALLNWSDGGGASLGVPVPVRVRSDDRTVTSVPLLGGTF